MEPEKKLKFIGITGGVGSGKSKVLEYIGENYRTMIILADDVANRLKEKGNKCYDSIVALLGDEVLSGDGEIDKRKMAERIFSDGELLKKVNDILHPATVEYRLDSYAAAEESGKYDLFFVEAALLIENGFKTIVDEMWYVYADISVRKERLRSSRGYSEEKIKRILASQMSDEEYRKNSDFVIDNSGSIEETYKQIDRKLEAYRWRE